MNADQGAPSRLKAVGQVVLIATIMAAPLPYGSVQSWAWASIALLAEIMFIVWAIVCVQRGAVKIYWSPLYFPVALFVLWVVIQLAAHLTMDYVGTRESVIKLVAFSILFFLAGQFWTEFEGGKWEKLGFSVSIYSFGIAFIAIVQFFSGTTFNYWNYWSVNSMWGAFGTYVNHNHYAGLMETLIPISITFAVSRPERDTKRVLLSFGILLSVASSLLSGSRGGFVALLVEIFILGMIFLRDSKVSGRRNLLSLGALGILGASILFFWIDPGQVSRRLEKVFELKSVNDVSYGYRAVATLDTLRMFESHPWIGTGAGSFETAFPLYQSVPGDAAWDHAHDDYAEGLAETGMIGGVFITSALALFLLRARQNLSVVAWNAREWIQVGATIGAIGVLVHSLFDFNLHIPANAAWFAVCCGIATSGAGAGRSDRPTRPRRAN